MLKRIVFLAVLALSTRTAQGCGTLKVKGFPDVCLQNPCDGGCDIRASDANGKWTVLPGVGEQLQIVDGPKGSCSPKLPVYYKTLANNITLFMFFDSQGSSSAPDETSGWAIGTSLGSRCNDDFGLCTYGQVPSTCCTKGFEHQLNPGFGDISYCEPYLMRKSEARVFRKDPRPLPQNARGWWQMHTKPACNCNCYAGFCGTCLDTRWATKEENKAIKIKCSTNPARNAVEPEFVTQDCPLQATDHSDLIATCRRDRCQGCCPFCNNAAYCLQKRTFWPDFFNPPIAECDHIQTSCGCDGENPVIDPTAV